MVENEVLLGDALELGISYMKMYLTVQVKSVFLIVLHKNINFATSHIRQHKMS